MIAAMRRNINVKCFVHDNQIYGLTEGPALSHNGRRHGGQDTAPRRYFQQFKPMALAVAMDCSFAARGYAADAGHLKGLMKEALGHKGFSLLNILQP